MSSDEEMAIIGKLVVEKRELARRNAALHQELCKAGEQLQQIGKQVMGGGDSSMFWTHSLTSEERQSLDAGKLEELLAEKAAVAKRYTEVGRLLREAGID